MYVCVCIYMYVCMYAFWYYACSHICIDVFMYYSRMYVSGVYTGCPRRNVPDFGRVFLMLKYTDTTQNTYA